MQGGVRIQPAPHSAFGSQELLELESDALSIALDLVLVVM
jgi:hypothetical protein